jgi:hypothetical protein
MQIWSFARGYHRVLEHHHPYWVGALRCHHPKMLHKLHNDEAGA